MNALSSRFALRELLRPGALASATIDCVVLGVALRWELGSANKATAYAGAFVIAASVISNVDLAGIVLANLWIGGCGTGSRALNERVCSQIALRWERPCTNLFELELSVYQTNGLHGNHTISAFRSI